MPEAASDTLFLAEFVRQLWETGQVSVVDLGERELTPRQLDEAWLQLQFCASEEQAALPGRSPGVSRTSAEWALLQFYRAASFLVHRTHFAEEMQRALNHPAPEPPSPVVCYSVDLVFRFLPDLCRMAHSVSPNDPLVEILAGWGRDWPFSSVGMEFPSPSESAANAAEFGEHPPDDPSLSRRGNDARSLDLTGWWTHDCLRRMYVDRVLRRADLSRLNDVRVADAVRCAIGNYPELVPGISAAVAGDGGLTETRSP